jgi:phosphohistidine phosphatase SixA
VLHTRPWARAVFDEADRHLAHSGSKRGKAAAAVLAPRRWALAGIAVRSRREVRAAVLRSIGMEEG